MKFLRAGTAWRLLLALVVVAVVVAAGAAWHQYTQFVEAPLAVRGQGQTIDIKRGTSFDRIVDTLRSRHLSAAPVLYWRVLARQLGVVRSLDAGEYALTPGMTPRDLLLAMAEGHVVQYDFTIVDGWTFKELREALAKAPKLVHTSAGLDGEQVMQRIGAGKENPEGWFLPETYAYVKGDTDISVLKRAWQAMQKLLASQWPQRDTDIPLDSPYQALILASIVEKETARADERPRIAGVFERRLKRGMRLQTDPAVIYGMGDKYHGDITTKALHTDTPYNTYLHKGLPPTPIAMPGKAALLAVLHPAQGKALYFVARGDGTGSHVFSDTLAEQNRAVACYQLKRCK